MGLDKSASLAAFQETVCLILRENGAVCHSTAMAKIREGMILGKDKKITVEPGIWTIEWTRKHYQYPVTRSNCLKKDIRKYKKSAKWRLF